MRVKAGCSNLQEVGGSAAEGATRPGEEGDHIVVT